MRAPLSFDKKNAEDFFAASKVIQDSLEKIRQDQHLQPNQTTLAKLSGLHRNTLRNRKWPLDELEKIKQGRISSEIADIKGKLPNEKKVLVDSARQLELKLHMSRDEVAKWFHRASALEKELEELKDINHLLKQKLSSIQKQNIAVDSIASNCKQSKVILLKGKKSNATISQPA